MTQVASKLGATVASKLGATGVAMVGKDGPEINSARRTAPRLGRIQWSPQGHQKARNARGHQPESTGQASLGAPRRVRCKELFCDGARYLRKPTTRPRAYVEADEAVIRLQIKPRSPSNLSWRYVFHVFSSRNQYVVYVCGWLSLRRGPILQGEALTVRFWRLGGREKPSRRYPSVTPASPRLLTIRQLFQLFSCERRKAL